MDDKTSNDNQDKTDNGSGGSEAKLLDLRNKALDVLLPMVDKLEEPAERKFEILITAARSSDHPRLLGKTLDAAQQIEGDSQKANAILDVLNEINYHLRDSA